MEKRPESQVDPNRWLHYVPEQVVLTGPATHVETLVKRLADDRHLGLRLEPAEPKGDDGWSLPLGQVGDILSACDNLDDYLKWIMLPDLQACAGEEWVMSLYKIDDGPAVPQTVGLLRSRRGQRCVHTDANLLIGYPYTVAGSPYTVAGSPYTVAGSGLSRLGTPATSVDFWSQWALEQIGMAGGTGATTEYMGQKVRVGVFDTSPFDWTATAPTAGIQVMSSTLASADLDWVDPGLDLAVQHPAVFDHYRLPPPPVPAAAAGGTPEPLPDLSDHGLSAAGLVYAVAKGCDIHLYRVLDQYARGNLFVLTSALLQFTESTVSAQDETRGGVISLSLGVPQSQMLCALGLPADVLFLNIALALAYCQGLVVVAASGNGSNLQNIAEPEIPAALPFVIGVAASNYDRQRACFSNRGDIAAPGGDGYRAPAGCLGGLFGQRGQTGCEVPWGRCRNDCWKYGLLGPILKTGEETGYARWAGTSFATPLVSGLAARILDKEGGWVHPAVVRDELEFIDTGAVDPNLGEGIIDVAGSLSP